MNHRYVFFLGNHPELSLSEAWYALSRGQFGAQMTHVGDQYALLTTSKPVPGDFVHDLGGTDRIAEVIATEPAFWSATAMLDVLAKHGSSKKITVGLSTISVSNIDIEKFAFELKTKANEKGIKLRFILPKKNQRLNAAQVEANHLTKGSDAELTIIKHEDEWLLTKTLEVQDIRSYELRDTQRPARDAKVGMLPPKLAQIMINLGLSTTALAKEKITIFDPFCGMGTVLQEAWMLDIQSMGTDINERMIDFAGKNLTWLSEHFSVSHTLRPEIFVHDARQPFPPDMRGTVSHIVTEPYLGKPLRTPLLPADAGAYIDELAGLYLTALKNLLPVLAPGGTALFLFPAFRRGNRKNDTFTLFPEGFLDAVTELGYSQLQLIPPEVRDFLPRSDRGTLLYSRPDALVGREFTLWQKAA